MKRLILASIFSLAVLPAFAGTFCVTEQKSTDTAPYSHCETTADGNIDYFNQAASATFYPKGFPTTVNNVTTYSTPTTQQIFDASGHAVWEGELANVNSFLKAQAAAQAAASAPQVQ